MNRKQIKAFSAAALATLALAGCDRAKFTDETRDQFAAEAARVVGRGWAIDDFGVDFPEIRAGQPSDSKGVGKYGDNYVVLTQPFDFKAEQDAGRAARVQATYNATYAEADRRGSPGSSSIRNYQKAKGCLQGDIACRPHFERGYTVRVDYSYQTYNPCKYMVSHSNGKTSYTTCVGGYETHYSDVTQSVAEKSLDGLQVQLDARGRDLVDTILITRAEIARKWRARREAEAAAMVAKSLRH